MPDRFHPEYLNTIVPTSAGLPDCRSTFTYLKRTHFVGVRAGQGFQPKSLDYYKHLIVNAQGDPVQTLSAQYPLSSANNHRKFASMKTARRILIPLSALYLLLLIPGSTPPIPPPSQKRPFAWNRDQYWSALQNEYKLALQIGCPGLVPRIDSGFAELTAMTDSLTTKMRPPSDSIFGNTETALFQLAPKIGVCRARLPQYITSFNRLRTALKAQSIFWDMNSDICRIWLYRLLYGGRTAIEQIMLQLPPDSVPALSFCEDVPSATPAITVLGVTIHSGDILVSRGGAPTSALIARGNDFPGNFSHIALVYVDSATGKASIIESHIEKGVAIATLDDYLRDTKLRVMVLRLRSDLPVVRRDPMFPHEAASYMLARVRSHHIPYDFQMDFTDTTKLFCSEVASQAYRHLGFTLWMGMSHISSPGVRRWLSLFGVTHFETQEPSDLEYDPQLQVVAEWRDPETLAKDQLDNAVIDVMLEDADRGMTLKYSWYLLPVARVLKAYSVLLNWFGAVGPIPEGMDPASALRNKWFSAEHGRIKSRLMTLVAQFRGNNGFTPPYWELIKLARRAERQAE